METMQNEPIHVQESRLAGMPLIAAAFLVGAILGGLLVVLFCAVLPEGGVMPGRFRAASLPEVSAPRASGRTEPVSANWQTAAEARSELEAGGLRGMGRPRGHSAARANRRASSGPSGRRGTDKACSC